MKVDALGKPKCHRTWRAKTKPQTYTYNQNQPRIPPQMIHQCRSSFSGRQASVRLECSDLSPKVCCTIWRGVQPKYSSAPPQHVVTVSKWWPAYSGITTGSPRALLAATTNPKRLETLESLTPGISGNRTPGALEDQPSKLFIIIQLIQYRPTLDCCRPPWRRLPPLGIFSFIASKSEVSYRLALGKILYFVA